MRLTRRQYGESLDEWAELHAETIPEPDLDPEYCRVHTTREIDPLGDGCDDCNAGPTTAERAHDRWLDMEDRAARMDADYDAHTSDI